MNSAFGLYLCEDFGYRSIGNLQRDALLKLLTAGYFTLGIRISPPPMLGTVMQSRSTSNALNAVHMLVFMICGLWQMMN